MENNKSYISSVSSHFNSSAPSNKAKENDSMSLPFLIKGLLICADNYALEGITSLFENLKNFELKSEPKLTFITENFQIGLVVYVGNEVETISDIEKLSNQTVDTFIIGDDLPQSLMRKALKLSVKDFIPLDTVEKELIPAIYNYVNNLSIKDSLCPLISVINGKGGAGSSFITNTLAQVLNNQVDKQIALFDADMQYGSLASSLNIDPEYYLDEALNDIQELDDTAIKSMMSKKKNINLLPSRAYSQINQLAQVESLQVIQLLDKIRLNYDLLVADLSRGLDRLSIPILEHSNHIFIVLQQNIASIRETKALIEQLQNKMGISSELIHIIVNRFSDKHSTISVQDIQKTTGIESVFKISNDYELANACTDLGKSLEELSNSKHLEKEVIFLLKSLDLKGIDLVEKSSGFWAKLTGK